MKEKNWKFQSLNFRRLENANCMINKSTSKFLNRQYYFNKWNRQRANEQHQSLDKCKYIGSRRWHYGSAGKRGQRPKGHSWVSFIKAGEKKKPCQQIAFGQRYYWQRVGFESGSLHWEASLSGASNSYIGKRGNLGTVGKFRCALYKKKVVWGGANHKGRICK